MKRVVITGYGVVSALGVGREAHESGLREGRNGIAQISMFPTEGLTTTIGAEAKTFIGEEHFTRNEISMRDRVAQMAIKAGSGAERRTLAQCRNNYRFINGRPEHGR